MLDPNRNIMYGNSYWLANAMLRYRLREVPFLKNGIDLQLNVDNLFDWDKPVVRALNANGSTRSWVIMEPRRLRLAASTKF